MINFYDDKYSVRAKDFFDKILKYTTGYKIGVIDWWQLETHTVEVGSLRQFLEDHEATFFFSEEVLDRHICLPYSLRDISEVLLDYNVLYITHSVDANFLMHDNPEKHLTIPWFAKGLTPVYVPSSFKDSIVYEEKKYTFSMLLGQERFARDLLFDLLHKEDSFYTSYRNKHYNNFGDNFEEDVLKEHFTKKNLLSTSQVEIDSEHYAASHVIPANIFNNSHFSVISETRDYPYEHFVTEKFGNQFLCGRFFVWWSSGRKIEYLNRFGFDFDKWFQYAEYDSHLNDITRLACLKDTVREISSSVTLQKEIYTETKFARRNNRLRYMDLVRDYEVFSENWCKIALEEFVGPPKAEEIKVNQDKLI